jgi:hypothetical protein
MQLFFRRVGKKRHRAQACPRVDGLETHRQISLYTVAGRQRSNAMDALIELTVCRRLVAKGVLTLRR